MPCFSVDGDTSSTSGPGQALGLNPIPTMDAALERDVAPYRRHTDTVSFDYNKQIPYDLSSDWSGPGDRMPG